MGKGLSGCFGLGKEYGRTMRGDQISCGDHQQATYEESSYTAHKSVAGSDTKDSMLHLLQHMIGY